MVTRRGKAKERKRVERKRKAAGLRRPGVVRVLPPEQVAGTCYGCKQPYSYLAKVIFTECADHPEGHLLHEACCPECADPGAGAHNHMRVDLTSESRYR